MSIKIKTCGRCSSSFDCDSDNISKCQCYLPINRHTLDFLSKTNFDCLCSSCLTHYDEIIKLSKQYKFPKNRKEYIEGVHYYKEGKNWVFTELYHIQKDHCCKNKCRHCPYGFQ
ncbi:MAG: cysteine-rich CWC family protein [Chitinophagales bacterium]|nr:cysteine-rich CWC family protein [Chitinophagales bacterium]MCZ2394545.1 cysteine-rich CWC family protein [Chitinophagales bacterium]